MKPSSRRPLLLAAALVLAAGLLPSAPAGATVSNTGTITRGTLTIGTYPAHFDVDLTGATGPCPTSAPTVGLNLTTTTGGWTSTLTAFNTGTPLGFTYAGSTWFLQISKTTGGIANNGTIQSAPTPDTWGQTYSLTLSIFPETTPGSCTPAGSARCSTPITGTLNGIVGSGGITGEDFDPGAELYANWTNSVATTSCSYPFMPGSQPATFFLVETTFP